jgi:hypothetical protein
MTPENLLLQQWKQQLDIGFRLMETILEGATRLYEAQLDAACAAHADAVATHKALARTTDASGLLQLQAQWAAANAQRWTQYWRALERRAA